jgi:deazaflavin-dependent oxidoreductase (nitroreductase family)
MLETEVIEVIEAPTAPTKRLNLNAGYRAANAIEAVLTRLGLIPHTYLLEVTGARTGKLRRVPVTLVENGDRWLVAPYGVRSWVRNVRANPHGRLHRGRHSTEVRFEEVGLDDAAPILQRYWREVAHTRPYFEVGGNPDVNDFRRIASLHPVFRVVAQGPRG